MSWSIDVKSYTVPEFNGDNRFIAIVPQFDRYLKNQKPINHLKLEGVFVPSFQYHDSDLPEWHPDNPFSLEKWIEVRLYKCEWKQEDGLYVLKNRRQLGCHDDAIIDTRYFVKAKDLQQLHWTREPEYRSTDRFNENYDTSQPISSKKEYYTWG